MQRQWSPEDKVRIALAAIKGELTIAEISSKFEVHSTQINRWKKQVLEGLRGIFSQGKPSLDRGDPKLIEELYQQIGKLKVENEWLKKKSEILFS